MNHDEFYKSVYSRDEVPAESYGWIQWKGTDVCLDFHCKCGFMGHIDGDFVYFAKCPRCKTVYALGQNINLIPLSSEEQLFVMDDRPNLCHWVQDEGWDD